MITKPIEFMSTPKTVEEFVVEGEAGGSWQVCGYRETFGDAMTYKASLGAGTAGDVYDVFRIRSVRTKYEESEQYLRTQNQ